MWYPSLLSVDSYEAQEVSLGTRSLVDDLSLRGSEQPLAHPALRIFFMPKQRPLYT
jgi:hypothetical protein